MHIEQQKRTRCGVLACDAKRNKSKQQQQQQQASNSSSGRQQQQHQVRTSTAEVLLVLLQRGDEAAELQQLQWGIHAEVEEPDIQRQQDELQLIEQQVLQQSGEGQQLQRQQQLPATDADAATSL